MPDTHPEVDELAGQLVELQAQLKVLSGAIEALTAAHELDRTAPVYIGAENLQSGMEIVDKHWGPREVNYVTKHPEIELVVVCLTPLFCISTYGYGEKVRVVA